MTTATSNGDDPLSMLMRTEIELDVDDEEVSDLFFEGFTIDDEEDDNLANRNENPNQIEPSKIPIEKAKVSNDPLSASKPKPALQKQSSSKKSSNSAAQTSNNNEPNNNINMDHMQASLFSLASSSTGAISSAFNSLTTKIQSYNNEISAAVPTQPTLPNPPVKASPTSLASQVTMPKKPAPDAQTIISNIQTAIGSPLLSGERVIMFLTQIRIASDCSTPTYNFTEPQEWCLAMTFYRFILFTPLAIKPPTTTTVPASLQEQYKHYLKYYVIQTPLGTIDKIEKTDETLSVTLYTKLGRFIQYTCLTLQDCLRSYEALMTYSFPGRRNLGYLFAFETRRTQVLQGTATPTLQRFHALEEYKRQGIYPTHDHWGLCRHTDYNICETYPSLLMLPKLCASDIKLLKRAAAFRSENRLPALAWGCPEHAGSIWRCSQPKVGLQGNRSSADEALLKWIADAAVSSQLKIFDLRPKSSAMANKTTGYGYENLSNYPFASLGFWNIVNIHSVRDSFMRLMHLLNSSSQNNSNNNTDLNWFSSLEDTKWLFHIRNILLTSFEVACAVHIQKVAALLHCSHGWDRTAQVSALAQILLDPYYRTIAGFATLVEKDFCSFGHPFHTRSAHGEVRVGSTSAIPNGENQTSPIFLQFLDCVYQILSLYPTKFEFTSRYLVILADHIYSCRFGTFLCDSEKEREHVANVRSRTDSVWDYLDSISHLLINPLYDTASSNEQVLLPSSSSILLRSVHLWTDLHGRFSSKHTWPPFHHDKIMETLLRQLPIYQDEEDKEQIVINKKRNICQELSFFCKEDLSIFSYKMMKQEYEMKELKLKQEMLQLKKDNGIE